MIWNGSQGKGAMRTVREWRRAEAEQRNFQAQPVERRPRCGHKHGAGSAYARRVCGTAPRAES